MEQAAPQHRGARTMWFDTIGIKSPAKSSGFRVLSMAEMVHFASRGQHTGGSR